MAVIKIENIVAYAQVAELLDIELISEKIPESSYNPDDFSGVSIKLDDQKIVVLVLSNGKIYCTGAKNIDNVKKSIKDVAGKIKKIGFELKKRYEIKIENVIASTSFGKELHLSSIANGLILQHADYNPENFPGLIYRIEDLCAVLILFSSGKLICTGTKSINDTTEAIDMMEEKLSSLGVL